MAIDLRKFTSQKEDVFLDKVFDSLWQETAGNERLRRLIPPVREEWKKAQADPNYPHGGGYLKTDLTPLKCWKLWVNGGLFHDDQQLRAEYAALDEAARARVDMLAVRMMMNILGIVAQLRTLVLEQVDRLQ